MERDVDIRMWELPGPDRLLWSIADVACYFGVESTDTIHQWIREGKFPAGQQTGGKLTWTGPEIAAFLLLRGRFIQTEKGGKVPEKGGKPTDSA